MAKTQRICIVVLLLLGCAVTRADYHIRRLTTKDGLASNYIRSMVQDGQGYLWLGTLNGLCRYDGYRFVTYTHATDSLLLENRILSLQLNRKNGLLWVKQRGYYISCYDTHRGQFVDYSTAGQTKTPYRNITTMPDGKTWLWTENGPCRWVSLACDKVQSGAMSWSQMPVAMRDSLKTMITLPTMPVSGTVITDDQGNHFVDDGKGGLYYFGKDGQSFHWQLMTEQRRRTVDTNPYHITTNAKGIAIVALKSGGVFSLDLNTGLQTDEPALNGLEGRNQAIMTDRAGNIWLSQDYTGLVQLSPMPEGMSRREANATLLNSKLPRMQGDVIAIYSDGQHTWRGTRSNGLFIDGQHYIADKGNTDALQSNKVTAICPDRHGSVWIGTSEGGFYQALATDNGQYRFRQVDLRGVRSINTIVALSDGRLAIGTNDYGLVIWNPKQKGSIRSFTKELGGNINVDVRCVLEDREQRLWVSTISAGLFRSTHKRETGGRLTFEPVSGGNMSLLGSVESMIQDHDGNVWIGTDNGLLCYDRQTHRLSSHYLASDMLGNVFQEQSALLLPDGQLAFGTRGGVLVFNPQQVIKNRPAADVIITNLLINGIPAHELGLQVSFEDNTEIELSHQQNTLTFHFSDLSFNELSSTEYSYWLEGKDGDWSRPSHLPLSVFQDLKPGHYTLHVRAYSGNSETPDHETTLHVHILPPWWQTWWAYLIYIVLALAVGYYVWHRARTIYRLRRRISIEKQLTEFKSQFFVNVSHEFRTPLTIIRGAMDQLAEIERMPSEAKGPLAGMKRSVGRLMRLNSQLMEYHRMEHGQLRLRLQTIDVVAFLRDIADSFRPLADSHQVGFQFLPFTQHYEMAVDPDKLDKIVYNLLSNAFKYTPKGGMVVMKFLFSQSLILSISDTGVGISKEKQKELFSRFMQSSFAADSMGIGLNLTYHLVQTHHGTISYCENEGGGSIFTVTLPTDTSVYQKEDFVITGDEAVRQQQPSSADVPYAALSAQPLNDLKILVVEDDDDVRAFVTQELSRLFIVKTAVNGQDALEQIRQEVPELVITDIRMPIMDGLTLLRKIRDDSILFDLPIIVLTAYSSEEKQLKGIGYGADDYVRKPFNAQLLRMRCVKLIEMRRKRRPVPNPSPVEGSLDNSSVDNSNSNSNQAPLPSGGAGSGLITTEQDRRFLQTLDRLITEKMSNMDLSVDELASHFRMGRSKFFEKVKDITGKTPNNYIRDYRLDRACELLSTEDLTVAKVAYQVGFSDPFYFSTVFKRKYGITPSRWQKGERLT